jgi:hypothetical protein
VRFGPHLGVIFFGYNTSLLVPYRVHVIWGIQGTLRSLRASVRERRRSALLRPRGRGERAFLAILRHVVWQPIIGFAGTDPSDLTRARYSIRCLMPLGRTSPASTATILRSWRELATNLPMPYYERLIVTVATMLERCDGALLRTANG